MDTFNNGREKAKDLLNNYKNIISKEGIELQYKSNDKIFGKISKVNFFWGVAISIATVFLGIGIWTKSISYDKDKNELSAKNTELTAKNGELTKTIRNLNQIIKNKNDSIELLLKEKQESPAANTQ